MTMMCLGIWEAIPANNTVGGLLCCWGNAIFSMSKMYKSNGFLAIEGNWRNNNEVITLVTSTHLVKTLEGTPRLQKFIKRI